MYQVRCSAACSFACEIAVQDSKTDGSHPKIEGSRLVRPISKWRVQATAVVPNTEVAARRQHPGWENEAILCKLSDGKARCPSALVIDLALCFEAPWELAPKGLLLSVLRCENYQRRDLAPEPSGGSRVTPTAGESRCGFGPGGLSKGLSFLPREAASCRLRSQTSWRPAMGPTL